MADSITNHNKSLKDMTKSEAQEIIIDLKIIEDVINKIKNRYLEKDPSSYKKESHYLRYSKRVKNIFDSFESLKASSRIKYASRLSNRQNDKEFREKFMKRIKYYSRYHFKSDLASLCMIHFGKKHKSAQDIPLLTDNLECLKYTFPNCTVILHT